MISDWKPRSFIGFAGTDTLRHDDVLLDEADTALGAVGRPALEVERWSGYGGLRAALKAFMTGFSRGNSQDRTGKQPDRGADGTR